jgi:hypothetical protein
MKDTSKAEEEEERESEAVEPEEAATDDSEETEIEESEDVEAEIGDERHATRTRAEKWARRSVEAGKLVKRPKGAMTPEKRLAFEEAVARKARQLVVRVILPGEWYLVRWGGTRKGAGTFYTRPGLAVPTVHRTLRPLVYQPPRAETGSFNFDAPPSQWIPKLPEEILKLKVCDIACGSGTFPVAVLRFLTDALYASLHYHGRITSQVNRTLVNLLSIETTGKQQAEEDLGQELLPCLPDDPLFEPRLKAILRRYVVERCIYGVDLDPLAVELCRLSLWIETMDRTLPFSFIDHKIKCGNSLVGAWFDQFQHYPVMAWKNREGGDKGHSNGMHFEMDARGSAIKKFVKEMLTPDLRTFLGGRTLFSEDLQEKAGTAHTEALAVLSRLHDLPVQDSAERARIYREELIGSQIHKSLKSALDLWCTCWFWPADELEHAPLPSTFAAPSEKTRAIADLLSIKNKFFHWELEFPDVFRDSGAGFDAILGNPPWDIAKPSSKEFFSNIDPLYRSYGKQEALRYQTEYFHNGQSERDWLDYNGDFRAQSNLMSYAASPFGDPKENEDSQDRFAIARGSKNDTFHSTWRMARAKSHGFADPCHPYRHQGSADLNLYKLSLERAHSLLRMGGRLGFIVPSGLYSDHGTGGLRQLFLNHCQWEWLFGFENREKVFKIDNRFKFNPVIIVKGGTTEAIRTAFMRRKLEDWEDAESFATPYMRAQVERFSPRSKAILEIQSNRDLEILEKIYSKSVLLGDDSPDGWGIKYATEFHMTNDSTLFPPRPKWEADGYRPDEYSRWLKGDWRPIAELWAELGVQPLIVGDRRCAQPPYDTLPIPRAEIPAGIILSREADACIREHQIEDTALPLYEGRMIGQFDFSQKGWVSGKGRTAVWHEIPWDRKQIEPQYLMANSTYMEEDIDYRHFKVAMMDVTSSTNTRTLIATNIHGVPCGHKTPTLTPLPWSQNRVVAMTAVANSLVFDYLIRSRFGGTSLIWSVLAETPIAIAAMAAESSLAAFGMRIGLSGILWPEIWLPKKKTFPNFSWHRLWHITRTSRVAARASLDALLFSLFGITANDLHFILAGCDYPENEIAEEIPSKGFWRVDKDRYPELRHTILSLVAFNDLEEKIRACSGDRGKGIEEFLNQNNGEGWMLPETLCLADYGLGHDERAKEHQPVASRLGPRFYDWQLAQSPEESWRECHIHARNLLGEAGYNRLLAEIEGSETEEQSEIELVAEPRTPWKKNQGSLF